MFKNIIFIFILTFQLFLVEAQPNINSIQVNKLRQNGTPNIGNDTNDKPFLQLVQSNGSIVSLIKKFDFYICGQDARGVFYNTLDPLYTHPGPLYDKLDPFDSLEAKHFNKSWQVFDSEIQNHKKDYWDNSIIDNRINSIYSWPGKGNPYFEKYNGFKLKKQDYNLAPFFDYNGDDIYNPDDGDYPNHNRIHINDININPTVISWSVFHFLPPKIPYSLAIEFNLLTCAYQCSENDIFDHTIFNSLWITNRGDEELFDFNLSFLTDFALGCEDDDYIGCSPSTNSFYGYNSNKVDATTSMSCDFDPLNYFLNGSISCVFFTDLMSTFMYYPESPTKTTFPFGMSGPELTNEYHYYSFGYWRDGSNLTNFGNGYNPGSTLYSHFAFSGNPKLSNQWSMYKEKMPLENYKTISSIHVEYLFPEQTKQIHYAFVYSQHPGANHLENVEIAKWDATFLRSIYGVFDGFQVKCSSEKCSDDCLWNGDTNRDGIVNQEDLYNIAVGYKLSIGKIREYIDSWIPNESENWNVHLFDSTDLKHVDADGNGTIAFDDVNIIKRFFGFKNSNFNENSLCNQSNELIKIKSKLESDTLPSMRSTDLLYIDWSFRHDSIIGVSFEVSYDNKFVEVLLPETSIEYGINNYALYFNEIRNNRFEKRNYFSMAITNKDSSINELINTKIKIQYLGNNTDAIQFTKLKLDQIKILTADGQVHCLGNVEKLFRLEKSVATKVDELIGHNPFIFYPNPTLGILNYKSFETHYSRCLIFNAIGQLIKEENMLDRDNIDITDLNPGIYFIEVVAGNLKRVFTVIKSE